MDNVKITISQEKIYIKKDFLKKIFDGVLSVHNRFVRIFSFW
ncbi:hypothetical protein C095_11495 [Fusobacterium necrophorum subsp. funduliforme B35]|uniref:Uncharacterized protein n=1 Tax=Fusobacterium necrophorum subsp. funduliforme B35 TaxID=1226633 RepID=A0A0B4E3V0_9FUSO|nr:hypothetical protein C095_11495 [Fusobacterium necrophorum subsp. funduliforme B35]